MKYRIWNRILALILVVTIISGAAPFALAAESDVLTRGEARDMLLEAADDYNPGVAAEDILHGYPDGSLKEEREVTRVEALVMISGAFGDLPEPVGDSARWGSAAEFSDVPEWAQAKLADVFAAGIVVDDGSGLLKPNEVITEQELTLLIGRVYALMGTNLKDDFYAAVNKEWLDSSVIMPGYLYNGTFVEVAYRTDQQLTEMIREIAAQEQAEGSAGDKIKTLYENVLDRDARNEAGIAPIKPYLDAIEAASSLDGLMEVHHRITEETAFDLLLGYGITQDREDTSRNVLYFGTMSPTLPREYYEDADVMDAMTRYCAALLRLSGQEEGEALADAAAYVELQAALADAAMSEEEKADYVNSYHVYEMDRLKELFPHVDLDALREADGLPARDTCVIDDPGLLEAVAELFTEDNLDILKVALRVKLVSTFGFTLNEEFGQAAAEYQTALMGEVEAASDEEKAAGVVQSYLSDYLGQLYVERYFPAEAKTDVENMIDDILDTYAQRIQALDWMSETTKEKAVEKLEAITVNVGYPDEWSDCYDSVDLRPVDEGGSYYENYVALCKAGWTAEVEQFEEPADLTAWEMPAYEVNAYYSPYANSINFPAAILQAPFYDVDADYTENLGGIGAIIAHEITHAFDNSGAQFDAQGNQNNWWTEADYEAFQALCAQVVEFYDGLEAMPGVVCSGALTLGENVADLGAVACITQIEGQQAQPDYETLFRTYARTWRSTMGREMAQYYAAIDVHGPDKVRGYRPLQTMPEFYEIFDIQPGDGMYLAPEQRVRVW